MAKKSLSFLLALFLTFLLFPAGVSAQETSETQASPVHANAADKSELSDEGYAFAVLLEDGELIFMRSNISESTSGYGEWEDICGNKYTGTIIPIFENQVITTWRDWHFKTVKKVSMAEGQVIRPKSTAHWFESKEELESVDLSNLDTSECVTMSAMFSVCSNLKSIDVSGFDTSNVTDMSRMFASCDNLTELDVSGFNTEKVTNMSQMFDHIDVTELDLSNFNTSKVTDMSHMFDGCHSLERLDLKSFNTSNVTNMNGMFAQCDNLKSVDVSSFDTSNLTEMESMFMYCNKLETLDLRRFNTSNVTNFSYMFDGCGGLASLDLSSFNTEKAVNMASMFRGCTGFKNLDLSNFNTSNVTNMYGMFQSAGDEEAAETLDISSFDTRAVTNMEYMFSNIRFRAVRLGKKFTVWKDNAYFRQGNWENKAIGKTLTEKELYNQYPANAFQWAGLWERQLRLPDSVSFAKKELNLPIGVEYYNAAYIEPFNAEDRTVIYSSSNPGAAEVSESGKIITHSAGTTVITATTANGLKATCKVTVLFDDVPASLMYYSDPVYWAVEKGITNGYKDPDGIVRTFKPQANCTREAVVTFLWRLAGKPNPKSMKSPFKDVQDSSKYYYKAVLWAAEKGITGGYKDGTFKPSATCLREHVVTFLWRYAGKPSPGVSKNPFNDVKTTDYYYRAALWANAKGIAKGYTSGAYAGGFGPKLDCLREHVVTFLYRFAK